MIDLQFQHEVLGPFVRFKERASENICVQDRINDVIVLAQEAATAAYHFPEATRGKSAPMSNELAESLRQRLADVVDSRKHGQLRDPARKIDLSAGLAFEFNDAEEFRYLGTEVWACNQRFGEFELGNAIERYIEYLRPEFSIRVEARPKLQQHQYAKKITTYFADKAVYAKNIRILTYKKTPDGSYVRADPQTIEFEVLDLSASKA